MKNLKLFFILAIIFTTFSCENGFHSHPIRANNFEIEEITSKTKGWYSYKICNIPVQIGNDPLCFWLESDSIYTVGQKLKIISK